MLFNFPSAVGAAQLVGVLVVPAGAAATLLGGWLVRRLRLARHQLLAACCALLGLPAAYTPRVHAIMEEVGWPV